jgi:hypothetical protein
MGDIAASRPMSGRSFELCSLGLCAHSRVLLRRDLARLAGLLGTACLALRAAAAARLRSTRLRRVVEPSFVCRSFELCSLKLCAHSRVLLRRELARLAGLLGTACLALRAAAAARQRSTRLRRVVDLSFVCRSFEWCSLKPCAHSRVLLRRELARLAGFEPATPAFGGQYSIQLSYRRVMKYLV